MEESYGRIMWRILNNKVAKLFKRKYRTWQAASDARFELMKKYPFVADWLEVVED
jgi:hypothetical protein